MYMSEERGGQVPTGGSIGEGSMNTNFVIFFSTIVILCLGTHLSQLSFPMFVIIDSRAAGLQTLLSQVTLATTVKIDKQHHLRGTSTFYANHCTLNSA